jgi:hypothetical protein
VSVDEVDDDWFVFRFEPDGSHRRDTGILSLVKGDCVGDTASDEETVGVVVDGLTTVYGLVDAGPVFGFDCFGVFLIAFRVLRVTVLVVV